MLSTLCIMGVCGLPLRFGLVGLSAGGWLRLTDPRLAPPSGGRRGFFVRTRILRSLETCTLFLRADKMLTCPLLYTRGYGPDSQLWTRF